MCRARTKTRDRLLRATGRPSSQPRRQAFWCSQSDELLLLLFFKRKMEVSVAQMSWTHTHTHTQTHTHTHTHIRTWTLHTHDASSILKTYLICTHGHGSAIKRATHGRALRELVNLKRVINTEKGEKKKKLYCKLSHTLALNLYCCTTSAYPCFHVFHKAIIDFLVDNKALQADAVLATVLVGTAHRKLDDLSVRKCEDKKVRRWAT